MSSVNIATNPAISRIIGDISIVRIETPASDKSSTGGTLMS
jgi:hypothetical protein